MGTSLCTLSHGVVALLLQFEDVNQFFQENIRFKDYGFKNNFT